jgi:hypothetical protein
LRPSRAGEPRPRLAELLGQHQAQRITALQAGGVVLADRKGRRFYAVVTGREQRELRVEPIDRRVTYHQVKAREVLEIWHKRRRRNGNVSTGQEPNHD